MIQQERLLKTFFDLVSIDSPTGEEERIRNELSNRLKKLGAETVEKDTYGNLIAKFHGEGEPLMINCHMDTVEPGRGIVPIMKGDRVETDGKTILAGDAKAGLAIILEALTSLKEENKKHVPIEIVFTVEEETGLYGAVNLDYSKVSAKKGFVFDGSKDPCTLTTSAPGYYRVDVTIIGRAAHAGAEPEKGISAIKIASDIITKLEVGRIDEETTANVGIIEGGSARNAVPEKAHFKAEIRSRKLEKLEKHAGHFQEVFEEAMKKHPEAKIEIDMHLEFNPYIFDENHHVIQLASKALSELGQTPKLAPSNGGSDVNIFISHDIETVAVGIGDYNAHTTREYVVISEIVLGARLCEKLLEAK